MKIISSFISFLICILTLGIHNVPKAYAHKVNVFAYAEQGMVYVEGYFSDGRAVEGGIVTVYDSQKHKLVEGKTDKEGKFSFPIPKKDNLTIVLNASMGHRNTYILKKEELGEEEESVSTNPPTKEVSSQESLSYNTISSLQNEIHRIAEEVVQLRHEILDFRREMTKPSLQQIFSGIGYILGIMGIGFYISCRKNQRKE